MDIEEARATVKDLGVSIPRRTTQGMALGMLGLDQGDEPSEEYPAALYALVQEMRREADRYEAMLIRELREQGKTWAEVAEAVDSHLGSRQAAHAKWKRLLAENRREYGGPGRGGRPRQTEDDAVNDSTTPTTE